MASTPRAHLRALARAHRMVAPKLRSPRPCLLALGRPAGRRCQDELAWRGRKREMEARGPRVTDAALTKPTQSPPVGAKIGHSRPRARRPAARRGSGEWPREDRARAESSYSTRHGAAAGHVTSSTTSSTWQDATSTGIDSLGTSAIRRSAAVHVAHSSAVSTAATSTRPASRTTKQCGRPCVAAGGVSIIAPTTGMLPRGHTGHEDNDNKDDDNNGAYTCHVAGRRGSSTVHRGCAAPRGVAATPC